MTDSRFFYLPKPRNACNWVEQQTARQQMIFRRFFIAKIEQQLEDRIDAILEDQVYYLEDLGNEYVRRPPPQPRREIQNV